MLTDSLDRISVKGCVPADYDICNHHKTFLGTVGTANELCGACTKCTMDLCNDRMEEPKPMCDSVGRANGIQYTYIEVFGHDFPTTCPHEYEY
jgi:hypothetical protein